MKRITTIFLIVLSGHLSMIAQTDTTAYSVVKNMPVFYEQLKQQLTYPAAWGNSPIRKFDKWACPGTGNPIGLYADFTSCPCRLCHDGNRYRTAQRIQGSKNTI